MASAALKLESAPMTPAEVSVLIENNRFVFRTDDAHAVYVSDADQPGKSACEDAACLAKWRPVIAPATAKAIGDWTPIARKDGKQWAFKGHPVYIFADDSAGTAKGAGGGWHVLAP